MTAKCIVMGSCLGEISGRSVLSIAEHGDWTETTQLTIGSNPHLRLWTWGASNCRLVRDHFVPLHLAVAN